MFFDQKLKSIQYNGNFAITGATRRISKQKFCLELFQLRRWYWKLRLVYKIYKSRSLQYLFKQIPEKSHTYATKNLDNILFFNIRHNFFKNSFLPFTIIEWNNLHPTLQISKIFRVFKNSILEFIKPS